MKRIFITISRGNLARNFLQNNFYKILRDKFKIVILTSACNDERFIKEFSHPNVKFIDLRQDYKSSLDFFIFGLHRNLIYNKYIDLKAKYGIKGLTTREDVRLWRYYLTKIIFKPLSRLRFLRDFVRFIDYAFLQRKEVKKFQEIIKKERPDLILSLAIQSPEEVALIKAARKMGIKALGMPKSWDNLSKAGFRIKADKLIVWSEFMVEQALKFQNYKKENIEIIGIPQFDYYVDKKRIWSREEFCRKLGLDPKRKIILFCSEGRAIPEDKDHVSIIYSFIRNKELIEDCQLLIRPHFAYENDEKKFVHLLGKPNVVIDLFNKPSAKFKDHWDYSIEHINRFVNMVFHSDLVVTTTSTITLDAGALDKPIINIKFDGYAGLKPLAQSIVWRYESDYYGEIVKTGAAKLAHSQKELKDLINRYLRNPNLEQKERQELRRRFCYRIDGQAGIRLAQIVINSIN